jgi:uncharacterized protein with FMN-binding domain
MKSSHQNTPKVIGGLAVAIVIGVGSFLAFTGVTAKPSGSLTSSTSSSTTSQVATQPTTATTTTTPTTTTAQTTTPTPTVVTLAYKNGTYDATSSYYVPGGQNSLSVTLTISGDKVTAVKTSSTVDSYESQRYVDRFNANISSAVVGTSLSDSANQSRVGGASLTTSAFDDAITQIMNNAKA